MNRLILTIAFMAYLSNAQSQAIVLDQTQNSQFYELYNHFKDFKIINFDQNQIWSDARSIDQGGDVTLSFDEYLWPLNLSESALLNSAYGLSKRTELEQGMIGTPFNGYVEGVTDSRVSLTIGKSYLYGNIRIGTKRYFIEPLYYVIPDAPRNLTLFYEVQDIIPGETKTCAATEMTLKSDQIRSELTTQVASQVAECFEVELAIASDFSMFQRYGSVTEVENHNIAVMNDVGTDYVGSFDDDIEFNIVTQFIVDCSGCDPWTNSTNAGTLLSSFTAWGPNNFGVTHDLGQLWSARNFNGGTIGVAWLRAVCTSNRYHVLEDFTDDADLLRVLTSHEIGHNFSSGHDPSGSGTIMSPSVNNTTTWSSQSINAISDFIVLLDNQGNCLSPCEEGGNVPVAAFTSDVIEVCENEPVQYTDLSAGAESWFWTFEGGTPATSTEQNPTVTYSITGIYDVTLEASNENGTDVVTESNWITVAEAPEADFLFNIFDLTVDFSSASTFAIDFVWNFGDGDSSFEENPTHTYDTEGLYEVTLVVFNECGQDEITILVTVGTAPIVGFSASSQNICTGTQVQFTDESSENTTNWSWAFEGGIPALSNEQNPIVTYPNSGVYNVQLLVSNGIGNDEVTQSDYITVIDAPTSAFDFLANGLTVDFINSSSGGVSYLWDFGDGSSSTITNPQHVYAQEGQYNVSLTATNMCGSVTSMELIVLGSLPTAGFTSDATIACVGSAVQYTDVSSDNVTSWLWIFDGGTPSTSTEQNPLITYNEVGTFDVQLTVSNGLGTDVHTNPNYIIIIDVPTADFSWTESGNMANFTDMSLGASSYLWDFGDGNTSTAQNPQHLYTEAGNYQVILTVSNECGEDAVTQIVSIGNVPMADFTSDVTTICAGDPVQFMDQSTGDVDSWAWTFTGGNPSTSSEINPLVIYANSGTYSVQLLVSNSIGSDDILVNNYIVVIDDPMVAFDFTTNANTIDFNNLSQGASSFLWDFGDGMSSTDFAPSHTYAADGSYMVRLTATNICGQVTTTMEVTVGGVPTAQFSLVSQAICPGETVQFEDLSTSNTTSWLWTFEGGTPSTSTDQNPVVTYLMSGTYSVTLQAINSLGSNTVSQSAAVNVLALPTAGFQFASSFLEVDFENTSDNFTSVEWDFGDGMTSSDDNPSHVYEVGGEYTVRLIATNECGSDETTLTVQVSERSIVNFVANKTLACIDDAVIYEDLTTPNGDSRLWRFEGGTPATSTDQSVVVTYANTGRYDVQLDVTSDGELMSDIRSNFIQIIDMPVANFEIVKTDDLTYRFNDMSDAQTGSYLWDFGDGETSAIVNPTHTYQTDDDYNVTLTISNLCGLDSKTISTLSIVSTHQIDQLDGISIFPNPTSGNLTMLWLNAQSGQLGIELYDVLGRLVLSDRDIVSDVNYTKSFQLGEISAGTYFLKVRHGDRYIVKPVIYHRE